MKLIVAATSRKFSVIAVDISINFKSKCTLKIELLNLENLYDFIRRLITFSNEL